MSDQTGTDLGNLLSTILGGNDASRRFMDLAGQRGISVEHSPLGPMVRYGGPRGQYSLRRLDEEVDTPPGAMNLPSDIGDMEAEYIQQVLRILGMGPHYSEQSHRRIPFEGAYGEMRRLGDEMLREGMMQPSQQSDDIDELRERILRARSMSDSLRGV